MVAVVDESVYVNPLKNLLKTEQTQKTQNSYKM